MESWFGHLRAVYGIPLLSLIACGFWLHGFRCFPWLAVNYYLKDHLRVDPGMLQFLQQTSNLPFLAKPVYGFVSDSFYVHGAHRVPYLILAGLIQLLSWGAIAFHPTASSSVGTLVFYLILSNLGVAIGEVANDAIIAEFGKRKGSVSGELQSFAWLAVSSGALLGNLLAGLALNRLETPTIFTVFLAVVVLHLTVSCLVSEKSLAGGHGQEDGARKTGKQHSVRDQLRLLTELLRRPDIIRPVIWCTLSVSVIPSLLGSVFYYQTQVLNVDSFYLGLSKTVGQLGLLLGSLVFNRSLKQVSLSKLAAGFQLLIAASILLDVLLVNRWNRLVGIPDELFVVAFSGLMEGLAQLKVLPFMVLLGKLCPAGTEGTVMAGFSACLCLANVVSGYFGVALASVLGISSKNFRALATGIIIEAGLAVSPVLFVKLLPEEAKRASN